MTPRTLAALALAPLVALVALPAATALGESCVVSVWTTTAHLTCTGTLPESADLTWCPNDPSIDCLDRHVLTCIVRTDPARPIICPL